MTKPKNFPGKKHLRRISVVLRLEDQITILEKFSPINNKSLIEQKKREISVLNERIKTGGRKSTKKIHANTGWNSGR